MVALSAVGIIVAFVLLIGGSWKKISMFLVAVICAGIIGATGGLGFIEAIKGPHMDGFTDFVKSWAVIIALGALLGSLYGKSGAAWRIGDVLIAKAGSSLALLVYVLVGALLVYCGIAVPVTLFVLLPFAKVIFPRAGIPWSLFPAVTGLGVATFAMYTPGSLQVINLIPTQYYGISTMAAPLEGFASSAFLLIVGILYLKWEIRRNSRNLALDGPDQYIVQGEKVDNSEMAEKAPPFLIALIPVVVTLILVNLLQIDTIISFSVGCILALVLFWKNIPDKAACISQGFNDGIMPCILVSAVVGLGSVISSTPVFAEIRDNVMLLPINGLAKVAAVSTIISGISASAAGGIQLAMNLFGEEFLSWGYSPDIIARVAAIASGGLDSMPWNGTVVMMFTLSGVGYSKGYKYVAVITVILPIVTSLFAALLYTVRMGLLG